MQNFIIACLELLVRKSVILGIEPSTLRSPGKKEAEIAEQFMQHNMLHEFGLTLYIINYRVKQNTAYMKFLLIFREE